MSKTIEVELRTSISGRGWSAKSGDRQVLPEAEARRLIATNQAVRIDPTTGQAMPLEGKPNVEPEHPRIISPRERGTKEASDGDGSGELVGGNPDQAARFAKGGRGVPSADRSRPTPESLDDEEDEDGDEFEPIELDELDELGIDPAQLEEPDNLEVLGLDPKNPEHRKNINALKAQGKKRAEEAAKAEQEAKAKAEAEEAARKKAEEDKKAGNKK